MTIYLIIIIITWGRGSCAWRSAYPSAFSRQRVARREQSEPEGENVRLTFHIRDNKQDRRRNKNNSNGSEPKELREICHQKSLISI